MYSCVKSYGISGIDAYAVTVETTLTRAMPAFDIVGLPDAAVKESRSRVQSALTHAGYQLPVSKITVNLAPASQKKSGPVFDLPIFLAVMAASGQIGEPLQDAAFVGELSLSGQLRPVNGALSMALKAKEDGVRCPLICPPRTRRKPRLSTACRFTRWRTSPSCAPACRGSGRLPRCPLTRCCCWRGAITFWRTWPMCAGSPLPNARWRLRRRAGTTCC